MSKRIVITDYARIKERDSIMLCPVCKKGCKVHYPIIGREDNVLVGGKSMRTNGGQLVYECEEHGVMRLANCSTDIYMKHKHPTLKLSKSGTYIPVTQVEE